MKENQEKRHRGQLQLRYQNFYAVQVLTTDTQKLVSQKLETNLSLGTAGDYEDAVQASLDAWQIWADVSRSSTVWKNYSNK